MYVRPNLRSRAALEAALVSNVPILAFEPGETFSRTQTEGEAIVQGPHAPEPCTWNARVRLECSRVVEILD